MVIELQTDWIGKTVSFYDSIDSTNAQAKKDAENGAENGALIVADMQTAGRGRRGRTWESPAGANIYFSLVLKPDFSPDKASMLTLVMALAVARGMEKVTAGISNGRVDSAETTGIDGKTATVPIPEIKWPNDIVMNGRKVCGILTEMSVQQGRIQHVIIGVGINVHKQEFAPELVDKATALDAECGQELSRSELIAETAKAFEEYYAVFERDGSLAGLRTIYNQKLVNRGREVRVLDPRGEYTGIATGINDAGELCVTLPDGSMAQVYAGEVSVRGIYGYV